MALPARHNKIRALTVTVIITFLSMTFFSPAMVHSQTGIIMPQKGMCYVTWDKNRFASQYSDASLLKLSSLGVEYISICVTQYQEKYNSTKIMRTNNTPSDKSLAHVIRQAHKLGMKVMLKPHVDLLDKHDGSYWRADIGFARDKDWDEWFDEYREFLLHYARLAKNLKVDIFCVGTELSFTTTKEDAWRDIIKDVRKVYSGELVYAANWDNFKNIKFWDDLDFIGIDAYFPLTYESNPTLEELKLGWEKWKYDIASWQSGINKPVIFTELGYASTQHAPYTPWKGGLQGNANTEIQAKCYEAFFQTVWEEPWLAGVYWWKWDTNVRAGGKHNRQFTPQNKPAQKIIEANYKGRIKTDTIAMAPPCIE